jgi:hypothetical protein
VVFEEEDEWHMRRRMHVILCVCGDCCCRHGILSYEEEDACHVRRRMHVV